MANETPPWAAYRALLQGRLVALDKMPGVRPINIKDLWSRLIAKCVIKVTKVEAQLACKTDQLCGGIEAGIEGGIRHMDLLW